MNHWCQLKVKPLLCQELKDTVGESMWGLTPPQTPLLLGEGLSGSPFPTREGGWGVRLRGYGQSTKSLINSAIEQGGGFHPLLIRQQHHLNPRRVMESNQLRAVLAMSKLKLKQMPINPILRWLCIILLVGMSLGFSATPAEAHGFQTAYLDLREQPSGQIDVYWKTPPANGFGDDGLGPPMSLRPIFPEHCTQRIAPGEIPNAIIPVSHWSLDCGEIG